MSETRIQIAGKEIGQGCPCFVVAEISANHNQSEERAARLVRLAAESGADAVKIQTYTPDTITLKCDNEHFRITVGPWKGQTLHELYRTAYTPWEWQPRLKRLADSLGIILFSSPFDPSAVEFLAQIDMPAYKIASFELVDIPLISLAASKGKPMILSTGMATAGEIAAAVDACRGQHNNQIVLLRCTSAYPADSSAMDLAGLRALSEQFGTPVGLSDHSMDSDVALTATALGACMVEKHFTERRIDGGPDAAFSLEPAELSDLVKRIRNQERMIGSGTLGPRPEETENLRFRRSLFVVADMRQGERFTTATVRSIRPSGGLAPVEIDNVLNRCAARDIARGTPLTWDLVA